MIKIVILILSSETSSVFRLLYFLFFVVLFQVFLIKRVWPLTNIKNLRCRDYPSFSLGSNPNISTTKYLKYPSVWLGSNSNLPSSAYHRPHRWAIFSIMFNFSIHLLPLIPNSLMMQILRL